MASFINMVRELPDGVLGLVFSYFPRNETAQILVDAFAEDKLKLEYVRYKNTSTGLVSYNKKNPEIFTYNSPHLYDVQNKLRPSLTGTNVYGDDNSPMLIFRNNISIGEKIRMKIHFKDYGNIY